MIDKWVACANSNMAHLGSHLEGNLQSHGKHAALLAKTRVPYDAVMLSNLEIEVHRYHLTI